MIPINVKKTFDKLPVFDASASHALDSWFPANNVSLALIASLEACRDMNRLIKGLDHISPLTDIRGLTLLATPLVSFIDNLCSLNKLLSAEDRSSWPEKDQKALKESCRFVRRSRSGALTQIRNKRSAHHYQNALLISNAVPKANAEIILPVICHGLRCIVLFLNHDNVFWWTKNSPEEEVESVTIFGEVATTFKIDEDRKVNGILEVTIAKDPRYSAKEIIDELICNYNDLSNRSGEVYPNISIN